MSQPKALFLADVIKADPASKTHHDEAAAELRRLHDLLGKANALCRIRAAEIERLVVENESLKQALAASCDEERDQLWEASPGGGCSRARSAEAVNRELLEILREFVNHYGSSDVHRWMEIRDQARAAIAKAEGAQK